MIPNSPEAWSERAELAPTAWEAALWSQKGQSDRFHSVIHATKPEQGETLLDYGCGPGALCALLPGYVQYLGYDWATGMLALAERDYPYHSFTGIEPHGPFDIVVCVGPFNLTNNWSKEKTWEKLSSLWTRTRRVLAVCLYAGDDEDCLIYDSDELWHFGASLGVTRVTKHLHNDLLLVVKR
jgi:SAM-dependent methyltransferase